MNISLFKQSSKYGKVPYYVILIVLTFLVYQSAFTVKPLSTIILSNVIIFLGLAPFYTYIKKKNFDYLPILELQGVFYALTFGYVALQDFTRKQIITDKEINITLLFVIIGLITMYIGFYYLGPIIFKGRLKTWRLKNIKLKVADLKNFAFIYTLIFILYNLFITTKPDTLNTFAELISVFSKGILFYLLIQGKVSPNEKILIVALILFDIISGLTAGVLASFSSLLVFIAIIYVHLRKKLPYVLGIIAIIFFVLMQTIKIQYRDIVWWGGGQNYNTIQRMEILYDLIVNYYTSSNTGVKQAADAAYYRIDHLGTTAIVISMTPDPVNYKYGLTYYPLFTKFIPRAIWKNKPEETTGNIWAKWYGLLNPTDFKTSYNLPWFTELYINFGPWGIILGMMFFGLFLRALVIIFSGKFNELVFLIGLVLTYSFYGPESHFSLIAGNLLLGTLAIYWLLMFINYLKFKV